LILGSGTSQVLLNGVLGRRFHCRRGVRQGDPLSPVLFVIAADLLQSITNKAKDCGILKLPIPLSCGSDFPVIQYTNDTIIILEACPRQLFFLKAMLNSFADSTGLHVNYHKSNIYPISVSEHKMAVLANTFHYKVGSLPFTYLELPLGLKNPIWKHSFLSFKRLKEDSLQPLYFYLRLVDYKWSTRYFLLFQPTTCAP
jgi:hypothetical protein